ncbi:tripeptidyl peptidase SED3 [Aulographum hederae CBS 113979]|uniref:tripeptidyl-peptidase II n=1 Tax=Aulographum hederae CBS 113979 TaxID=1176131 RepID=A0A6G1H913_9PEZI|nr:tripeptidyl peptidase SED3 [Aulographum hederae CBS 113979]
MRVSYTIAGLLSLASTVCGLNPNDVEVLEDLRYTPQGWEQVGVPEAGKRLHFRIAVTQPNPRLLEQTLYDVSTPGHRRYGQFLKRDELKDLLRPVPAATKAIMEWLSVSGIETRDVENDGEWINFIANVTTAEKMMDTEFHYWTHLHKPVRKVRTLQYSIPRELLQYVDMIQPTTRFGQIRPQGSTIWEPEVLDASAVSRLSVNPDCNTTITPQCLKDLYQIEGFTPSKKKGGFIGINGFLEQWAQYADLTKFLAQYAPWAKDGTFSWTSVDGGVLPQGNLSAIEANLDIDYTVSLTYPLKNNFYSTAGRGPLIPDLDQPTLDDNQNEPYLDFFTYLKNLPDDKLPHTLTTSYGEDEQSVPATYSTAVCNLIGQLGARGVSILFSSGDTGVGSACQTNDGKNTTRFLPIFPAACPYVTSVGGTHYINPESAIYFSSGGFSDRFPMPSYQKAAVHKYLSILGKQWKGLYNPKGRGFPDIAAQGSRFHVRDQDRDILVGGTSASAPTVASIVALLNAARVQAGKKPLGFLNPWLYKTGVKGLTDIVVGGSRGCTGTDIYSGLPAPYVPYASWNATKGWDPVTGLGTPVFKKLLELSKYH